MSAPKFKVGDRVRVNPKLLRHWMAERYTCPTSMTGRILRVHDVHPKNRAFGYIIEIENSRDGFRSLGFDEDELHRIR